VNPERRIRVLIVDDSAIVRRILSDALAAEPDLEVVGTAPDPFVARDKIQSLKPDVLTLDIEMPRMDGLTFLKRLMHYNPMPVIVISSLGQSSCRVAIEALELGAVEVLAKPGGPYSVGDLRTGLGQKIRAAARARLRRSTAGTPPPPLVPKPAAPAAVSSTWPTRSLIAIGASTGGTEAIQQVLMRLPADVPGIVITQHIPAGFSRAFASRLNEICPMTVREAANGDRVLPGLALIAPGNFHMVLERYGKDAYRVAVKDGPLVCYQRPSVDVMFESVAAIAGADAVGAILTGMGSDGAQGMLRMRQAGARTIAQDEATCVVYGMPREAVRVGAVEKSVPLDKVAGSLLAALRATVMAR
jgi:two-component system chemotaxis response regulator CheB